MRRSTLGPLPTIQSEKQLSTDPGMNWKLSSPKITTNFFSYPQSYVWRDLCKHSQHVRQSTPIAMIPLKTFGTCLMSILPLDNRLHILFREWPCGRLNDWPQLHTPPYIHALCYVILLFLLLKARNNSQPHGGWAWPCDLLWQINVSGSGKCWSELRFLEAACVHLPCPSVITMSLPRVV